MHYEIRIKGVLDHDWSTWFEGLQVSSDERGETTIAGPIADQARCTDCWPRCATSALSW